MDSLRLHSYSERNNGVAKSQPVSVPVSDPTNSKMKLPSLDKLFPEFPEIANSNTSSTSSVPPTSASVPQVQQQQQVLIQQQQPQPQTQPQPQPHIRYSSVSAPLPPNASNMHQVNAHVVYPNQQLQQQPQMYHYQQEVPRQVPVTSQQPMVSPTVYHNYPSPPPTYYGYGQPQQQVMAAPPMAHQHTAPLAHNPSQMSYSNAYYPQPQPQAPTPFMYNSYQAHRSSSPTSTTSKSTSNRFKCDQCDKAYTRKHNLISHKLSVHEREKLFQCSKCKVKFSRASDLSRHTKEQHSKLIKPFICAGVNPDGSTWGCGKRFYRKDQLRSHLGTNKAESKCFKRTSNHKVINNGEFGSSAASTFPVVYEVHNN